MAAIIKFIYSIFVDIQREVMEKRTDIYVLWLLFFCIISGAAVGQNKWTEIYNRVLADEQVPDREEVLILIQHHNEEPQRLESLLRYLNEGRAYAYLSKHLLPRIERRERVRDTLYMAALKLPETTSLIMGQIQQKSFVVSENREERKEEKPAPSHKTVLAIKNNLLYDLALAPNIEVELPMGQRWSLNVEYKCPWWSSSRNDFCYQLISGGVETRYWLGNRRTRRRLTGHFLGIYAEGGEYDFQLKEEKGYRGKYYAAAGVTYGYTHPMSRHLAIEFSIGIGYLDTEYREYTAYNNSLVWTSSGKYHFIGPTKAKVSLVWLITARR